MSAPRWEVVIRSMVTAEQFAVTGQIADERIRRVIPDERFEYTTLIEERFLTAIVRDETVAFRRGEA